MIERGWRDVGSTTVSRAPRRNDRFRLRRNDDVPPSTARGAKPHTAGVPWRATWVCQSNPAHIEVVTLRRRRRWRAALGGAEHD